MGIEEKYLDLHVSTDKTGNCFISVAGKMPEEANAFVPDTYLEAELKERIDRLQKNLSSCGTIKNLLKAGGEKAKAYLNKTGKMLCLYLYLGQCRWMTLKKEEVYRAYERSKETDLMTLLTKPWNEVEKKSEEMRTSFINSLSSSSFKKYTEKEKHENTTRDEFHNENGSGDRQG